jgi:hypothetical protein
MMWLLNGHKNLRIGTEWMTPLFGPRFSFTLASQCYCTSGVRADESVLPDRGHQHECTSDKRSLLPSGLRTVKTSTGGHAGKLDNSRKRASSSELPEALVPIALQIKIN